MVEIVKLNEDKNKKENPKKKIKFSFKKIFIILILFFLISSTISSITYINTPKIGVVKISGPITTTSSDSLFSSSTSSRQISNILADLEFDDSVKAVLIDINSPGGSPVASDEISNAIIALKSKKPVYSLINDMGASGAYWVAVSTDKIYASSMSTVGSIGVTSAGLSFENLIKNYNITYRQQISGKYKDIGTPFREQTKEEKQIVQNLLNTIHQKFIYHVAFSRNLSYDYVKNYSTGEIFLGDKAKKIGFIDEIGYYPNVLADLKTKLNLSSDPLVVTYNPKSSFLDQLSGSNALSNWIPFTQSSTKILLK